MNLLQLNSIDLLDVLHYYFEVDHHYSTAEEAEARSTLRTGIYRNFYDITYKYQYKTSNKGYNSTSGNYAANGEPIMDGFVGTDVEDPLQEKKPTKPFVPATEFNPDSPNPFGGALDPPAG